MRLRVRHGIVVLGLLLGSPLLGLLMAGRPLEPYLEFPPRTSQVVHEPFTWPIFVALGVLVLVSVGPVLRRVAGSARPRSAIGHASSDRPVAPRPSSLKAFPWWGWVAACWTGLWWVLAWTRSSWMAPMQAHTFTPLWLGYIVAINAWTWRRAGHCMMLHRPRYFLALFPLSAAFWWFFEYLNRFVQNWYYEGGADLSPFEYVLRATIPFSTVLPAVLGTAEWLSSYPRLAAGLGQVRPMPWVTRRGWGWGMLIAATVGLAGIGIWPGYLFPMPWVAPLLVIVSLQVILGEAPLVEAMARGDWRSIGQAALAALICGFFWEMWNSRSLARWVYAVPYVQRFHVFEMPLLGYAGYLPFGLECLVVADAVLSRKFAGGVAYYASIERAGPAGATRNEGKRGADAP